MISASLRFVFIAQYLMLVSAQPSHLTWSFHNKQCLFLDYIFSSRRLHSFLIFFIEDLISLNAPSKLRIGADEMIPFNFSIWRSIGIRTKNRSENRYNHKLTLVFSVAHVSRLSMITHNHNQWNVSTVIWILSSAPSLSWLKHAGPPIVFDIQTRR